MLDLLKKANHHSITLSLYFDGLRLTEFDAVIFYSFLEVSKFVDYCPSIRNKLMLLVEDDYFALRNNLTSDILPFDSLHRVGMKIMEKPKKR